MQEYNYSQDDSEGAPFIPVSKLSTARINELLSKGVYIVNNEGMENAVPEHGMEQLRIELEIRTMEGRL